MKRNPLVAVLIVGVCVGSTMAHPQSTIRDGYQRPVPLAIIDDRPTSLIAACAPLRFGRRILATGHILDAGEYVESASLTAHLVERLKGQLPTAVFVRDNSAMVNFHVNLIATSGPNGGTRFDAVGVVQVRGVGRKVSTKDLGAIGDGSTPIEAMDRLLERLINDKVFVSS